MTKEIHVRETAGIDRDGEFIRVSVPLARGELRPDTPLCIIGPDARPRPCQVRVLKLWPDGSVKWLLVDLSVTISARNAAVYRLVHSPAVPLTETDQVRITPQADTWRVDTGAGLFYIDAHTFRPFVSLARKKGALLTAGASSCRFSIDGESGVTPLVEDIHLEENGPLRAVVSVAGRFDLPGVAEVPRFHSRLHFFAGSMSVRLEFTLHNPRAAEHPGGLWDLGDPGSLLFKELAFTFSLAEGAVREVSCSPGSGAVATVIADDSRLSVYQESSGGANWRSPNNRNREGRVPMTRSGYSVEVDERQVAFGLRASPLVWCGADGLGVAAALPSFWQEFPKEIEADSRQLKISLFPARFPDRHELQGGEQKTHVICMDFAAQPNALSWALSPVRASASPTDYRSSGIFIDLPGEADLIDLFSSASAILDKREAGDEYGWRDFGEVYADHEAVFHQGKGHFVSHYNNQYDFCAGAYRKFFVTGDPQWEAIAADLARHVLDIDIYHTGSDCEEYNHGLFWHTDHYIDAGLASHRSYSREHLKTKEPRFCGGGPGTEHCYTTGLMLHYFQTGNPAFKQVVIDLAEWILRSLTGPKTVLAALRRGAGYVSLWRSSRGTRKLFPRYPLTRGTGNAINACLDAFEIGGGKKFLDEAEKLVRGSIHPDDDISARNLPDAETAWSYTVLLVAVAKFLDKKLELGELDDGFSYARASLIAYAEWMLGNEYPFLEKPEILEYPNETWPAQDLRKSVVFFQAARYAGTERREAFRKQGLEFFKTAREELLRHETCRFARPLVLMLQNGWVGVRLSEEESKPVRPAFPDRSVTERPTPHLGPGSVVPRICSELASAIRETTLEREVAWLRRRLKEWRRARCQRSS